MSGDTQTCESAELIRVLEQLPEGVLIVDGEGVIQFANKPGCRLVKLKPKKALGSKFEHDIVDGTMRDFDVEMTVKEIAWSGVPSRLLHLKSLKSSGAFHLEWKLEAAVERTRELEQELEQLKAAAQERVAETSASAAPAADLSYYEDRIAELEQLLELAEQRADEMQRDIALDDHEQDQALQDALRQARDAEQQVRQLEEDLEESRERIRVAEEQAETAEERAYSVELELEQHLSESEEGAAQTDLLQQEIEDLRTFVTTWRESADRLTTELEESETRNQELAARLEEAKQQLLTQEESAGAAVDEEQLASLNEQLASLNERIAELEAELKEAQDDREVAVEESGELAEQLRVEMEQFEERTQELEEQLAAVQGELESSKAEAEALVAEKQGLEARLGGLEGATEEKSALETRLAELEEGAAAKESLEEELAALKETAIQEKAELEDRIKELEDVAGATTDLEQQIAELQEQLSRFEETESEKAELETRLAELEEVAEEKAALEERLAGLEEAAEAAAREAEEEAAGLEALGKEKEALQERVAELEETSHEVNRLKKDVRRLEKLLKNSEELAQKGEKVEKLERKLDGALRRAEEAEERLLEERRLLNELKNRSEKGALSAIAGGGDTERLAFQDELTGLPNRNILHRYLGFMLEQSARHKRLTVVVRLDCDNFKQMNDTFGNEFGDRLLRSIGERLSSVVRGTDVLGRYGEDEFVLLLSELSTQDEASVMTAAVVKRVYQKLRQPFQVDDHSVHLGMSMGVSIYPSDARNGEEMFEHSSLALKRAKERGKNQCQYFRAELQDQHEARAELDAQLKRGLEQEQFEMQYQPIFDLKAGQVIGLEALMRWNHPQHGILNPDSFLKVAEDSGLIVLIGNWAVRHALRNAAEWQRHGVAGFVSINLSKRQLMQSELVPNISSLMAEFGCVPDRILFEVPELVTGPEHPQIRETLVELMKTGARLAIDNFGTSSTSLQDLRRGPFTVIKVDRKFVRGLPGNEENAGIVLSALNMGHHLGRISVAVGVESEPERKWLEQTGCLYAQGNALSAPLAANQVADFVKRS